MNTMHKSTLALATLSLCTFSIASTPAGFTDDFEAAKAQAKASGRYILADFSGSDWCGWCKRLDAEVFAKPEFVSAATNNFVLLMVDTPRDTSILSDQARKANPGLVKRYRIRAFPSVLILDADGKVLDHTGYQRGGPAAYLEMLDKMLAEIKIAQSYEARITALPAGSLERAKLTDEFLMKLDLQAQMRHENLVNEVLAADPDGKHGLRAHYGYFTCSRQAERFLLQYQREVGRASDRAYDALVDRAAYNAMSVQQRSDIDRKVQEKVVKEDYPMLLEKGEAEVARLRAMEVPADAKEHFDTVVTAIDDVVKNIRRQLATK